MVAGTFLVSMENDPCLSTNVTEIEDVLEEVLKCHNTNFEI